MFNVLASILAALTMVSAQAAAELPDTAAVYDNTAAVNVGAYYADEDFDGVCDYFGENCRHLDLDGDGVCDNRVASRGCHNQGSGLRHGCRR